MKGLLKEYTSFTRTERTGIIVLLSIILLLIIVKATMQLWIHPTFDAAKEARLVQNWEAFKAKAAQEKQPAEEKESTTAYQPVKKIERPAANTALPPVTKPQIVKMFAFDPNTIDSTGLIKLGLKEKTVAIFLHWREKGKRFYNKEELKKVYTLTPEDYTRLEPYIQIDRSRLK